MPSNPYEIFLSRYGSFTSIQNAAIKSIEEGENCIITAPTGSGKTEAAILPLFKRLTENEQRKGICIIYITPLRALNRDLIKRLEAFAKELGISIAVRHGDTPTKERQLQAANPPQVLITTPETLQNLFLSARLRNSLANVQAVVVDEIHELYSNKRGAQLSVALERLVELSPSYQRIGISATLGSSEEAKRFLCGEKKCKIIEAKGEKEIRIEIEMPTSTIKDQKEFREKFNLDVPTLARIERIAELVKGSKSTLIFANTRQVVESLGSKLVYFNKLEPFGSIGVHHSSLDRNERIKVENEFREGRVKSIIATSSLELGIDIGAINLVVQYGSPRQVTRLIQRVGRGGHREKEISFGRVIVANYIDILESLAISEEMREGRIERAGIEENALDVLANQICAIVLEYKKVPIEKMRSIIKRSSVYSSLKKEDFEKVLSFLDAQRLVRVKEEYVSIGFRSRPYFFSNISVIPDTIRYYVKNTADNKIISTLDEQFATNYLEEGAIFITKGLPWKVVSIEKDVIFVEPSADFEAAIPDWEGEDIPVSRETAERVHGLINTGVSAEKIIERKAKEETQKFIESQKKYFTPSKETLVVEELEGYAVVHLALGKRANEFLAKIVGHVASQFAGNKLMVKPTAYALIIDFGGARRAPDMKRVFDTIKNYSIKGIMEKEGLIANTDLFRYKFVQICKLFGIVEKRATVTKRNADKLISYYKDSPISEETERDLRKNYFDIETIGKLLDGIRKGKITVKVFGEAMSPLANEILKATYRYRELLLPALPDETTIQQFEQKINEKKMELLCTYCGLEFSKDIKVEADERISCPRCKSPMVGVYGEEKAEAVRRKIASRPLNQKMTGDYKEVLREASLVDAYGSRALAAMSVYGIGTTTAARALRLLRKDYKRFIIDLIEAQKNFVRTKKYWK